MTGSAIVVRAVVVAVAVAVAVVAAAVVAAVVVVVVVVGVAVWRSGCCAGAEWRCAVGTSAVWPPVLPVSRSSASGRNRKSHL